MPRLAREGTAGNLRSKQPADGRRVKSTGFASCLLNAVCPTSGVQVSHTMQAPAVASPRPDLVSFITLIWARRSRSAGPRGDAHPRGARQPTVRPNLRTGQLHHFDTALPNPSPPSFIRQHGLSELMTASPTPGPSRLHTHSPAGLRLALLNISERSAEQRRSAGVLDWEAVGEDNVVISHPPR